MKRISMRLIVAILTFVIGVLATFAWFVSRKPAPPLTVCDLIRNPDAYASKNIRVRAVLFGYHEMGLYAPDCQNGRSYIHANFDRESWKKFTATAKHNGRWHHFMDMNEPEYLVDVTVRGRFEKLEEAACDASGRQLGLYPFPYTIYCYDFFISEIELVEPTSVAWPR